MRRTLPGYAVPRYVQEIAGEAHKHILALRSNESAAYASAVVNVASVNRQPAM